MGQAVIRSSHQGNIFAAMGRRGGGVRGGGVMNERRLSERGGEGNEGLSRPLKEEDPKDLFLPSPPPPSSSAPNIYVRPWGGGKGG